MKEKNVLTIKSLHFDAAHYLTEDYGKCKYLHGHRYEVNDVYVTTERIVDFNEIKKTINMFDHCLIIPQKDADKWFKVEHMLPCELRLVLLPANLTLAEYIKDYIKQIILTIDGVTDVSFNMNETENYGVTSES